jgi:hypothetical protein
MKRGKKKLTIVNIVKKIREKKVVALILLGVYLAADILDDGMVNASLALSMLQTIH